MKQYFFSINISNKDFLPYYKGQILSIVAVTTQGVKVQFPAMHLRKYLSATGIQGHFCLKTENNKFLSLKKI
ncbi:MAG: DUF2835 domain-containing protein [Alteromonadaceae bacterium]|nr:DUF2835 domain-containing protein [Alteromonadaceae bacterium]